MTTDNDWLRNAAGKADLPLAQQERLDELTQQDLDQEHRKYVRALFTPTTD